MGDMAKAVGVSRPDASAHLRVLRLARLVANRPDGRRCLYRLASPVAADVLRLVCGP